MRRIEQVGAPERGGDRQREARGKTRHRGAGRLRPAAAAEQHDRPLRRPQQLLQPAHIGGAGPALDRLEWRRVCHRHALDQHVLGQRHHHRAGAAAGRGIEGARGELGDAGGIVDFRRPFRQRGEHRPIVELLERLALAHLARDLAHEQDQRGGILPRDVDARRRVGGAGAAGDEADAGPSRGLAVGFCHDRGAALVAANGDGDVTVVQRIERGDVALARDAEHVPHPMNHQLVDQDFGGGPGAVTGAHGGLLQRLIGQNLVGIISEVFCSTR